MLAVVHQNFDHLGRRIEGKNLDLARKYLEGDHPVVLVVEAAVVAVAAPATLVALQLVALVALDGLACASHLRTREVAHSFSRLCAHAFFCARHHASVPSRARLALQFLPAVLLATCFSCLAEPCPASAL